MNGKFLDENDSVIFLDIDGVLNSTSYMVASGDRMDSLDPVAISTLSRLVDATNAIVVLSSTWRILYNPEEMNEKLHKKGARFDIHSFTPIMNTYRGVEIGQWLNQHTPAYLNFNSYIILDDDSDMLLKQKDHFFYCCNDTGLTPSIAYKAWRFFNSRRNWYDPEFEDKPDFGMDEYIAQWKKT